MNTFMNSLSSQKTLVSISFPTPSCVLFVSVHMLIFSLSLLVKEVVMGMGVIQRNRSRFLV